MGRVIHCTAAIFLELQLMIFLSLKYFSLLFYQNPTFCLQFLHY